MKKEPTKKITIEISETVYKLLLVVAAIEHAGIDGDDSVRNVVEALVDHAQQGVYRPGSWERPWLTSCFGDEWTENLEPGDPYGRAGCETIFQRPRR